MKIHNPLPTTLTPEARKTKLEGQIRGASEQYEQHFLNEMVKAMRQTIHHESGFTKPNMAENIFSEELDHQYVEKWAAKGGIGLSDMIYNQLHERIFPKKIDFSKPAGPIPLDKPVPFQIKVDKKSEGHGQIQFRGETASPLVQMPPVVSPWSGKVESATRTDDGWSHLTIQHDNSIRSQLAFKGTPSQIAAGSRVEHGQTIGILSQDSPQLRWDVVEA